MNVEDVMRRLPLKEMDGTLLALTILNSSEPEGFDRIKQGVEVASYLHRGSTRANRGVMPCDHYITHPLRNTLRLMRWGCTDVDIIVASLLHDTVEDCFTEMLSLSEVTSIGGVAVGEVPKKDQIEEVLRITRGAFGENVERILRGVTNPVFPSGISRIEKEELYRQHVLEEVAKDQDVLLVKLSDFIDNAGSLHYNLSTNKGMVEKLARKYTPLVEPLKEHAETITRLPNESVAMVSDQLERIGVRLAGLQA